MCGRFGFNTTRELLAQYFGLDLDRIPDLPARYNVAPTQRVATVRRRGEKRELALPRWGLTPSWAPARPLINAKAETVDTLRTFRAAFRERRCLVPASGFYEWPKDPAGKREKRPYWIAPRAGSLFAFAGLWETGPDPQDPAAEACAILTTAANPLMQPIHSRQPVILEPSEYVLWLDPEVREPQRLKPLLVSRPYPDFAAQRVGEYVNKTAHEGPECVETARELF